MADRLWLLAVWFLVLGVVFLLRLTDLQLVQGERLAQAVDQSLYVTEVMPPRRGRILDRHGTPLVDNKAVYNLAVVFADLELRGRARREVPIWRLDESGTDALVAALAVRLQRPPAAVRELLLRDLAAHPGVASRLGPRTRSTQLGLLLLPRKALAPTVGDGEGDSARLAEGDLLSEDPREALERELALRWDQPLMLVPENEFQAACLLLDQDFNTGRDHCAPVLDPFMPAFTVTLPLDGGGRIDLALRLVEPPRRDQAESVLAQLLGETPRLVHERLDRALAAVRKPAPATAWYFAPSARADSIAPLLPAGQGLHETPITGVPGVHERILLVQGDPPGAEGLFTQICRRLAADFSLDVDLMASLIENHGERLRPVTCEREYRVHQIVLDAMRCDRLSAGLAAELTRLGQPTTRLDVEQALARARTIADRAWEGQTRLDPLALIRDVPHRLAVRLAGVASAPPSDLRTRYDDTDSPLPGLGIQVDLGREHPFPGSSSHLIGTIAHGSDPEETGLFSWQGRSGLELTYDSILRGKPGSVIKARTPDGVHLVRDDPPTAGVDLVTELDMELQTLSEDSLTHWYELAQALGTATDKMDKARAVGKGRAGFVLIDCHTGGILACASSPSYRLDELRTRYQELVKDPGHPLLNFATAPDQPPGSSMKIATALACLEHGVLNPGEEIYNQGYMAKRGDQKILRDHAAPGSYDLPHAIQASSNVYFAIVAHRLGGEKLAAAAELFGLGRKNARDVADQLPGVLPRPSTIARLRPKEPKWLPSDDWRLGIGQFLTASPLQVSCLAAAVANGGRIVTPYLVKPPGQPEVKDLHIRKAWLDEVRHGMEMVTSNLPHSTAKLLVMEGAAAGIKVAAKTGTAEWGSPASREAGRTPDHAWMIGYAPADNPTVAFACFIHSGTFGGQACTPIAKRVLERYFTKYGKQGHAAASTPAK